MTIGVGWTYLGIFLGYLSLVGASRKVKKEFLGVLLLLGVLLMVSVLAYGIGVQMGAVSFEVRFFEGSTEFLMGLGAVALGLLGYRLARKTDTRKKREEREEREERGKRE